MFKNIVPWRLWKRYLLEKITKIVIRYNNYIFCDDYFCSLNDDFSIKLGLQISYMSHQRSKCESNTKSAELTNSLILLYSILIINKALQANISVLFRHEVEPLNNSDQSRYLLPFYTRTNLEQTNEQ